MILFDIIQGRPQDLGGGPNFFFRFGNLHVVKPHAAHGKAMRIARWVPEHGLPRKIFKTVQLVCFMVYFEPILSLFFSKITIFYL